MRIRSIGFLLFTLVLAWLTSALVPLSTAVSRPEHPQESQAPAEPEWIDWGDLLYEAPSFIFYTARQDQDTNPCVNIPESVIYGRVPNGGGSGDKQKLLTGCDVPQATWFVVDSNHIYYLRKQTSEYVLARRHINGQPPDEILDEGVDPTSLVVDNDYVYYSKSVGMTSLDQGIWRIEKDGPGPPDKIVDVFEIIGNQINRLHLDGTTLYWTEGNETIGAVRAAPKTGGAWSGIAQTGVTGAQDVKTDSNYIYWSEIGGRIMRYPKAGGADELLHTADFAVRHIDIGDDMLAFTQGNGPDGSIWRVPAKGGTAEPLVSAQASPGPIAINTGFIYWNSAALKRIPLNAEPIELDYVIDWAEVTQAVQDGSNSVQLVAEHATYVRVYAHELAGESPALVRAALTAKGPNGVEFPGSPLISGGIDVPNSQPSRADTTLTFLFTLPEDWIRAGEITLELEINPLVNNQQAFETTKTNNQYSAGKFNFKPKSMCVLTYPVAAVTVFGGVETITENTPLYYAHYDRAESMLPAQLGPVPTGIVLWKADGDPFDLRLKPDREELKATMGMFAAFGDDPFFCGPSFSGVQGLVHPNAEQPANPEGGLTSGQGFSNPPVSWVQLSSSGNVEDGYNSPGRGDTLAHELGHTQGSGHIGCSVTPQDNSYPYPLDQLDFNDGETSHWGFDGITNTAINPEANSDFMTYCSPEWVSDYTWDKIGGFATLSLPSRTPLADHLDAPAFPIRYHVNPESGAGTLGRGWLVEEADLGDGGARLLARSRAMINERTDFGIAFRDGRGALLGLQPVEPDPAHEAEEPGLPGVVIYSDLNVMDFDKDTKLIQLVDRRTDAVLDELPVSNNHPVVTNVQVDLDEVGETLTVKWQGADRDGDNLRYLVRYSRDGAEPWQPVAAEIDTELVSLPLQSSIPIPALGGSDTAVFQVIASDGVHTGKGQSEPFSLPKSAPTAIIVSPSANKRVSEADVLSISGRGFDPEDGPLHGRSLTWLLDGEVVGYGRWLHLANLTPGKHTLVLRALDNDGRRAEDRATLTVDQLPGPQPPGGDGVFMPVVIGN